MRNIEKIENLNKRKTRLGTLLRVLGNSNEHKKIRNAAEEKVTNILLKKETNLAVSSHFGSIIRDPDKFSFLVSSRFYNGGHYAASQPYIGVYRALILDEAQKIFELMVRDLTSTIVAMPLQQLLFDS